MSIVDPIAWFAEFGLAPGAAPALDISAYSAMLTRARADGGPWFHDWVITACERVAMRYGIRHRTAHALLRDFARAVPRTGADAATALAPAPEVPAAAPRPDADVAASPDTTPIYVHRGAGRWEHLDPVTGAVLRHVTAPAGPDGTPCMPDRRYPVVLQRDLVLPTQTLAAGEGYDVVVAPGGALYLVRPGGSRYLTVLEDPAQDITFVATPESPTASVAPAAPARKRRW